VFATRPYKVAGFSGRCDLTRRYDRFPDLFGGHYDANIYFHTPNHFVPNLPEDELLRSLRSLDIRLTVGGAGLISESNRQRS